MCLNTCNRSLPVRVVVVGKKKLDQVGICAILASLNEITVVGNFLDSEVLSVDFYSMRADVLIWCLTNAVPEQIIYLQQLLKKIPCLKIVSIITSHTNYRILRFLTKDGCHACISERDVEQELPIAFQYIINDQQWISPGISSELCISFSRMHENMDALPRGLDITIARLLAKGYHNQDIAKEIGLSSKSVERRLTKIYQQLHVKSRTEAIVYFMNNTIILD